MKSSDIRNNIAIKCFYAMLLSVLVLVGAFALKSFVLHISSGKVSCPGCNIVILDIDVLRADDLHCDKTGADLTPNLCRLIRQSVNFSNTFSQADSTLPSSMSTYTSLYPSVNRVWDIQTDTLASSTMTLATSLRQYGYDSSYSGYPDLDAFLTQRNGGLRGYTHIYFHPTSTNDWLDAYKTAVLTHQSVLFHFYSPWLHMPYLLNRGETPIAKLPKPKGFPVYNSEFDPILGDYLLSHVNDVFTSETIAQHPEIFKSESSDRNQRIVDYFTLLDLQNDYTKRNYSWDVFYNSYMQFINPDNPADVAYLRMMYDTKVHTLDLYLTSFVDYLLQPDVASHTIVVLTSSHGESFGEHGTFAHDLEPYNELYRVPLVIKYPGGSGREISAVVENVDIFPTLAELVTGKTPPRLQGTSLLSILSGVATQAKSYAISMSSYLVYIIQNRKYAVIVYRDNSFKPELYDLLKDPTEQHDIAAANPKIVDQMVHLLISTRLQRWFWLPKSNIPVPTGTDRQKLIRSGYF